MSVSTDATNDSSNDSSTADDQPHFEGVIDSDTLDPFFRHMEELVEDYKVVINSKGFHIRVNDRTNVVMFDVRISNEDWIEYNTIQEGVIGMNHQEFQEMVEFIDNADGDVHITVEDNRMTVHDNQYIFTDTALINTDVLKQRPELPDLNDIVSRITFDSDTEQLWDLKKWVRSVDSDFQLLASDTGVCFNPDTNYKGNQTDEVHIDYDVRHEGNSILSWYSRSLLYDYLKAPLKAQLTGCDYVFRFYDGVEGRNVMEIEREYENSKLKMLFVPKTKR